MFDIGPLFLFQLAFFVYVAKWSKILITSQCGMKMWTKLNIAIERQIWLKWLDGQISSYAMLDRNVWSFSQSYSFPVSWSRGLKNDAGGLFSHLSGLSTRSKYKYSMLQGSYRSWKTLKVMKFKSFIFQAWKVIECNNWQSWKAMGNIFIIKVTLDRLVLLQMSKLGWCTIKTSNSMAHILVDTTVCVCWTELGQKLPWNK